MNPIKGNHRYVLSPTPSRKLKHWYYKCSNNQAVLIVVYLHSYIFIPLEPRMVQSLANSCCNRTEKNHQSRIQNYENKSTDSALFSRKQINKTPSVGQTD